MDDLDILSNIDLSGVDLARPLLPKQTVRCRVSDLKVDQRDNGTANLVIQLTLERPAKDTKGNTVNVGFVLFDRIMLTPVGGLTQAMIAERLARFQVAVLRQPKQEPTIGSLEQYVGKEVDVIVDVRNDKTDSSIQYQDVKRYLAIKETS